VVGSSRVWVGVGACESVCRRDEYSFSCLTRATDGHEVVRNDVVQHVRIARRKAWVDLPLWSIQPTELSCALGTAVSIG
jgi:hypothetical protein